MPKKPTTHTPGPWTLNSEYVNAEKCVIAGINRHYEGEGAANARLIAAAPDLLTVVQQLASADMSKAPWAVFSELQQMARAAVAKAEGREGSR